MKLIALSHEQISRVRIQSGSISPDEFKGRRAGDSRRVEFRPASERGSIAQGALPLSALAAVLSACGGGGQSNRPPVAMPVTATASEDGTPVTGSVDVSDPDGDTLTYNVSQQGSHGSLSVSSDGMWTYEVDNGSEEVNSLAAQDELVDVAVISVSDGQHSVDARIEITITGVNDPPGVPVVEPVGQGTDLSVSENDLDGEDLGQVASDDPEGGVITLSLSGPYSEYFEIVGGTLRLREGKALDFEQVPGGEVFIEITASDDAEDSASSVVEVRIRVVDEPEPPTVETSTATLDEDGQAVTGSIVASDPEGDPLTYNLAQQGRFGTLSVSSDGSWSYDLNSDHSEVNGLDAGEHLVDSAVVTVSDGQHSVEASIEVKINGVNDAPSVPVVDSRNLQVSENQYGGAELGRVSSVDPEGHEVSLSLGGRHSEYFELNEGVLSLKAGVALNYEEVTDGEVLLTITATDDSESPKSSKTEVRISVIDEPEAPSIRFLGMDFGPIDLESGVALGEVQIRDPDAADADLGVEHISVSDDRFEVREHDGKLVLVQKEAGSVDEISEIGVTAQLVPFEVLLTVVDTHGIESDQEKAQILPFPIEDLVLGDVFEDFIPGYKTIVLAIEGLEAGKSYRIRPDVTDEQAANFQGATFALYDQTLAPESNWLISSPGVFAPTEDGTQHVVLRIFGAGTLSFIVEEHEYADDFGADIESAGTLVVGGSLSGSLEESGDEDWIAVELESGKGYQINFGDDDSANTFVSDHLYNVRIFDGHTLIFEEPITRYDLDEGYFESFYYEPQTDGPLYVSVTGVAGNYQISIEEAGYTPGVRTNSVSVDWVVYDTLIRGLDEEDRFAVELEAGKTYSIGAGYYSIYDDDPEGFYRGHGDGGPPSFQPHITAIYDNSGREVEFVVTEIVEFGTYTRFYVDDEGIPNSELATFEPGIYGAEFTPEETGTYYISITAPNWEGHSQYDPPTIPYSLVVSDISDHVVAYEVASTLDVSGGPASAEGNIESPGEFDRFSFMAEEGVHYRIEVKGADTGGGSLADPWVQAIYTKDYGYGEFIDFPADYDGGRGRDAVLSPIYDASGEVSVLVRGEGSETGTYTVTVAPVEPPDSESVSRGDPSDGESFNQNSDDYPTGANTTLEIGSSTVGNLEMNSDTDSFAVSLEAGKTYVFELEGDEVGKGTLDIEGSWIRVSKEPNDPRAEAYIDGYDLGYPSFFDIDDTLFADLPRISNLAYSEDTLVLEFAPDESGTFYVTVGALSRYLGGDTSSGTYTLSVREAEETPGEDDSATADSDQEPSAEQDSDHVDVDEGGGFDTDQQYMLSIDHWLELGM